MKEPSPTVKMHTEEYYKQKVASFIKVSREFLEMGHNGDDFIMDQLSAQLYGFVYESAKESGSFTKVIKPQSFWDWIRRKPQVVTWEYEISKLLSNSKVKSYEMPIIRIIEMEDIEHGID